MIKSRC